MCFHFPVMPRIYYGIRDQRATQIVEILADTPPIPKNGAQWSTFLRNHDELTLEMVSTEERASMYGWYAPDSRMRANVGIRRRLAPLLDNSRKEIELAHALLLSLPGSPCLYYGDEIGMGDNIWLPDRDSVRTPMQWTPDRNAGFSTADPGKLYLPLVQSLVHHYSHTNVEAQLAQPTSLLHWVRGMLTVRRQHPALGAGEFEVLTQRQRLGAGVLPAHVDRDAARRGEHGLDRARRHDPRCPTAWAGRMHDVFGGADFPAVRPDGTVLVHPRLARLLLVGADRAMTLTARTSPDDAPPARGGAGVAAGAAVVPGEGGARRTCRWSAGIDLARRRAHPAGPRARRVDRRGPAGAARPRLARRVRRFRAVASG